MDGITLLEKIKNKEIKNHTKFLIINGDFNNFHATLKNNNLTINPFGKETIIGTRELIQSEFKILDKNNQIKEEDKSISEIIYRLISNPSVLMKQCSIVMEENRKLNEKIAEKDKTITFLNGEIEGLLYQIKK